MRENSAKKKVYTLVNCNCKKNIVYKYIVIRIIHLLTNNKIKINLVTTYIFLMLYQIIDVSIN